LIGHALNPGAIMLARRWPNARVAIVEHRGRRSGRIYRVPVEARRAPDGGFIIPLTWGEDTDWFRNVRAAGGCGLHWHGTRYALVDPEIVSGAEPRSAFHPLERFLLELVGVRFVHLRTRQQMGAPADVDNVLAHRRGSVA
jgi:deazaflavin-dependent oxidoreductase (nitroreductase family)